MTNLVKHLALVSESATVRAGEVMKVAAALQKQAIRDLAPIWNVSATVDAFARLEDVPLDYWPIILRDDIDVPGAAGIHLDNNGQPFALVTASNRLDVWSLTAAHESCEMLVDPFGNRLVAGQSPHPQQDRVSFLVEVCDPSEAAQFAYSINGVLVSDFYTPNFFDPTPASGVRYSFTGAVTQPRTILRGGYLSWVDLRTNHWWQQRWFDGAAPDFVELGPLSGVGSLRSQIDRLTTKATEEAVSPGRNASLFASASVETNEPSSAARAGMLHSQIDALIAEGSAAG